MAAGSAPQFASLYVGDLHPDVTEASRRRLVKSCQFSVDSGKYSLSSSLIALDTWLSSSGKLQTRGVASSRPQKHSIVEGWRQRKSRVQSSLLVRFATALLELGETSRKLLYVYYIITMCSASPSDVRNIRLAEEQEAAARRQRSHWQAAAAKEVCVALAASAVVVAVVIRCMEIPMVAACQDDEAWEDSREDDDEDEAWQSSHEEEMKSDLQMKFDEKEQRYVAELNSLKEQNASQREMIDAKEAEIEALVEQINTLEARLREAENESEKKRLDHERGLGAMAELDAILKERSKEIDEYARKQSALEAQVANQEKMLAAKHAEMESKLSEQSSANEQILAKDKNTLQTRISELEKKCSNQLEQLDASALKLAEREAKLLEQSSANEMLAEENTTLQRKVSDLERACSEQTQELESSAQKHADENSKLLTTTSNLEKTCSDQSKELEASALRHGEMEAKLLQSSANEQRLAGENSTLQMRISDLEKMCSDQSKELEVSSELKHVEMKAELSEQSSANEQVVKKPEEKRQSQVVDEESINSLNMEANARIERQEKTIRDLKEQNSELQKTIDGKQSEKTIRDLKEQNSELQKTIDGKQSEWNARIKRQEATIRELQAQNSELKKSLDGKEAELGDMTLKHESGDDEQRHWLRRFHEKVIEALDRMSEDVASRNNLLVSQRVGKLSTSATEEDILDDIFLRLRHFQELVMKSLDSMSEDVAEMHEETEANIRRMHRRLLVDDVRLVAAKLVHKCVLQKLLNDQELDTSSDTKDRPSLEGCGSSRHDEGKQVEADQSTSPAPLDKDLDLIQQRPLPPARQSPSTEKGQVVKIDEDVVPFAVPLGASQQMGHIVSSPTEASIAIESPVPGQRSGVPTDVPSEFQFESLPPASTQPHAVNSLTEVPELDSVSDSTPRSSNSENQHTRSRELEKDMPKYGSHLRSSEESVESDPYNESALVFGLQKDDDEEKLSIAYASLDKSSLSKSSDAKGVQLGIKSHPDSSLDGCNTLRQNASSPLETSTACSSGVGEKSSSAPAGKRPFLKKGSRTPRSLSGARFGKPNVQGGFIPRSDCVRALSIGSSARCEGSSGRILKENRIGTGRITGKLARPPGLTSSNCRTNSHPVSIHRSIAIDPAAGFPPNEGAGSKFTIYQDEEFDEVPASIQGLDNTWEHFKDTSVMQTLAKPSFPSRDEACSSRDVLSTQQS